MTKLRGLFQFSKRPAPERKPATPGLESDLAHSHNKRDPEENRESCPPSDEHIDVHCIWVVELYLPSHLDQLTAGFQALEWAAPNGMVDREGLEQWIQDATSRLYGTAWKNLNIITRPGDDRFQLFSRSAPLPNVVDYARGSIHYIFPGLVGVVLQFVLKDDPARCLESELRCDRKTFARPHGRGWSFITPFHQKTQGCQEAREALRQACASWFRSHLPGFFASLGDQAHFPTGEFIMFEKGQPYLRLPNRGWADYLRILQMDHDFDAWYSKSLPGIRLGCGSRGESSALALTFATREDEFFANDTEDNWRSYGGRNREGYTNRLSDLERTVAVWAVHALLTNLEGQVAALWNRVAAIDLSSVSQAAAQLESVQADLLTVTRDALPLASELKHFCEKPAMFHVEVYEFLPASQARSNDPPLFEGLRETLSRRAGLLEELAREIRDAAAREGSLVATMSQDRATKTTIRLNLVLSVLTGVLVVLTGALVALSILWLLRPP